VIIAVDTAAPATTSEGEPTVVGFINAISDGLATAFLPWLEVLPDYQGRGIGRELTKRMLAELADLY
jgi:ribosomal protein S18 acetylase RimI-like enzyme